MSHDIRVDVVRPTTTATAHTFYAGFPDRSLAILRMRPAAFCFDFSIDPSCSPTLRLSLARSLFSFAQGYVRHPAAQFSLSGCLFQVLPSNATMEAFARSLGGEPEPGLIHRIDFKP